ncbi:MAG: glycosyltransferase family 1 protein [Lachnospiraceae bacterium]|nr:glycosyltransferase family 1 protein [Lachnospiraceae bacterium]
MKIVLFKNTVESQEFFSFELAKCFSMLGHEIFIYDCADPISSKRALDSFVSPGETVFLSFNFNGMINDPLLCEKNGKDPVYLKKTGIPIINIVVDHPYYYHKEFVNIPEKYIQISIDENHAAYMERFFPEINASTVIYLGGTQLIPFESGVYKKGMTIRECSASDLLPFEKRRDDIIFCGNYMRPEYFLKYLKDCDRTVIDFYMELYGEIKAAPEKTLEETAIKKIKAEFGDDADDPYLRDCLENMIFLDLMVRHYFRGLTVSSIADAGIKITVYGAGYDELDCRHPENIVNMGNVDSISCLKAIANSRISLNIMPWFKKGGHDRVYNTCLNGALCLSDPSEALKRQFKDMQDIAFFDIENIDDLGERVADLLSDKGKIKDMALFGYENAHLHHSWYNRALELERVMKDSL